MISLLAMVCGLLGSYLLYMSWKEHSKAFAVIGWGALVASIPLWVLALGAEYGSVFALALPALYVWAGILREKKVQGPNKRIVKPYISLTFNRGKWLKNSGYILYHLVLLMLVSSLTVITLLDLLPLTRPTQLATGIILIPLLWSGLSFWHLSATNKRFSLLFSLMASLVSSLYLFAYI